VSAPTLNQRWAATLVGTLVRCGVSHVVIAPGSRSTPLALACAERSDLRVWSNHDERSASFFALGLAKALQAPVAVVCTSGTAGAHFLPAAIEAAEGGTPLVLLTADRPWELVGFGAPQAIDQRALFGDWVRSTDLLPAPEEATFEHLVAVVSRAVSRATGSPRGAVHLNVPFREPLVSPEGTPGPVVNPTVPRFERPRGVPSLGVVREAIAAAKRGVIVCGPRERDDGFSAAVHHLGAALGFPVLAEAASNARFGASEVVSHYDVMLRHPGFAEGQRPDLVLKFGGGLTTKVVQAWLDGSGARTFAFSDEGAIIDPAHRAEAVFAGDVVAMVSSLSELRGRDRGRASWHAAQAKVREALTASAAFDEPHLARTLVAQLPAGTALVLSSSMPIRDVDTYGVTAQPVRVFSNRGVNGIDGVTSTAMGIAASGRPTVLLVGDVALLHDLSAWVALKRAPVPLTVVVVNNDGGGIFSFLPVATRTAHFEALFGTPHGVELSHVAALGGARYEQPGSLEAFAQALRRAVGGPPTLLELRTTRASNVEAHQALNARLAQVLETP
jgi:2-succinyl-5-enolpyruvyl-6-hydroxy-3-cyclohexene-1-carboxylate synthase